MSEAELALRIEYLQKSRDEELKARKYVHNMIEDMSGKLSGLEQSAVRFEAYMTHRDISESGLKEWLSAVDARQRVIERLVWIAVGGLLVIGALVSIIGGSILKLLATSVGA